MSWQHKELEEIYAGWEYKLREKLTDANDFVRRIHKDCTLAGVKSSIYHEFMSKKIAELLKEICDEAEETKLTNWAEEGIVRNDCKK